MGVRSTSGELVCPVLKLNVTNTTREGVANRPIISNYLFNEGFRITFTDEKWKAKRNQTSKLHDEGT